MKRVEREGYSGKLLAKVVFDDMHSSLLLQGNNHRTWNNTTPIWRESLAALYGSCAPTILATVGGQG